MLSHYIWYSKIQNTWSLARTAAQRLGFLTMMSRQTQPKTTLLNALALGAGSFARAIEVIHKDSGESFVLKTYGDRSEKARSSFERECILAMELAIRDLAPMIFVCDLDRKWIIVERVIPLDQWLRTQKNTQQLNSYSDACTWCLDLIKRLAGSGVVNLDIKPANLGLRLGLNGLHTVVLLDTGIDFTYFLIKGSLEPTNPVYNHCIVFAHVMVYMLWLCSGSNPEFQKTVRAYVTHPLGYDADTHFVQVYDYRGVILDLKVEFHSLLAHYTRGLYESDEKRDEEYEIATTGAASIGNIVLVRQQMIMSFPSKPVHDCFEKHIEGQVWRSFRFPLTRLNMRGSFEVPEDIRRARTEYKKNHLFSRLSSTSDADAVSSSTPINT